MKDIIRETPFDELSGLQLEIIKLVPSHALKNKSVLDIGCGFGWFEHASLKHKVKSITGVDISPADLKAAKMIKDPRARFKVGSAIKLPFKNNSFDTVVSWEVIEHIPKHTEPIMFSEVYRVLKPGGYFFLSTPHAHPIAMIFDPAWWLIGHRHYKVEDLKKLAKTSGFIPMNVYIKGGLIYVICLLNLYISKWIFKRDRFFKKYLFAKLNEEFAKPKGFTSIIFVCKKK